MAINAHDAIVLRRKEEWDSMLQDFLDSPDNSANDTVLGMNKQQRDQARGIETGKPVPTWV